MAKKIILLFLLIPIIISAQQNEYYFVNVKLNDQIIMNKLEVMKLPVYHKTNEFILTKLSSSQIKDLQNIKAAYEIETKIEPGIKYYFKNNDLKIADKSYFIIKADENKKNIFLTDKAVELKEFPSPYKNERFTKPGFLKINYDSSKVAEIINDIKSDSVRWFIQNLQNFKTRFLFAENRDEVANWIEMQFRKMGFSDVVIDSFQYQNVWHKNVIATLHGSVNADEIYVVGGHHDSYSSGNPYEFAPGADDNASGATAVLEIARVLMRNEYKPESTIRFITFGAEEYGLHGSLHDAKLSKEKNENIRFMINHDMISFTNTTLEQSKVSINYYTGAENFSDLALLTTNKFTKLQAEYGSQNVSASDSYAYYKFDFPAVYFEENYFSPYYHSPADTIGNYSMEYCAEVIKASCATLLNAIVYPENIKNLQIADVGDGNSLNISWDETPIQDFDHYNLYMSSLGEEYNPYELKENTFQMNIFEEGKLYNIGVSVVDTDGNESFIVEKSGIPYSKPLAASVFNSISSLKKVELNWNMNKELDFKGYNIYRSLNDSADFEKLNAVEIVDTIYFDESAQSGIYYYYFIESVDNDGNTSKSVVSKATRTVSLDQGILIVDDTKNGNGSLLAPTDDEVDNYYSKMLKEYNFKSLDLDNYDQITLSELGPFSTLIWHNDDPSSVISSETVKVLEKYFEYGGNFIYSGYKPTKVFSNNTGISAEFGPEEFVNKYFNIISAEYNLLVRFNKAEGNAYGTINIDTAKTKQQMNYHLNNIESIVAGDSAEEIFFYGSGYDNSESQGLFNGKPIGIKYNTDKNKIVVLSFPLYYMDEIKSNEFINSILKDFIIEVTPVKNINKTIPTEFALKQNYPNPFNPATTISYQMPTAGKVVINIYNVLGKKVAELVNEFMEAGYHSVKFNAENLSSGIYFYNINIAGFNETKKMMLVK